MKNFFGIVFFAALNLSAIMFEDASCAAHYDDVKESLLIKTELVIPSHQYFESTFPETSNSIKHSCSSLHFIPVTPEKFGFYQTPNSSHLSLSGSINKPQVFSPVHSFLIILRKNNSVHQSSDDDIPLIDYSAK